MTLYRLFSGVSGPSAASPYSGPYSAGTGFMATQGGCWLAGYSWWCCDTGQDITTSQPCDLWQVTGAADGSLIPAAAAVLPELVPGTWNDVMLGTWVPLSIGTAYMAATGFVAADGFPVTENQFGSGDPYAAGITSGPLFAYPNGYAGTFEAPQGAFSSSVSDPSASMPAEAFNQSNFWLDVILSDTPPAGAAFELWPSQPVPANWQADTPSSNWTLGTEFHLADTWQGQPVVYQLDEISFFSPPGSPTLPTETGIYSISGQDLVPGTHDTSPSWSGDAGGGIVANPYAGTILQPGQYKAAVFNGNTVTPDVAWSSATYPYWGSNAGDTGPGAGGITSGPLSAPSDADAASPGQSTYNIGDAMAWPDQYASGIGSANYWVSVKVTPLAVSSGALISAGII